ncbi:YdcF family protein [Acinetobacter sp. HR7]|uniref:YdcF family protein n=1 Tax=Acinetobacter sp. HR7 TaxID=1509403 RepID=UPI0005552CF5|nr:YdcF family protein [Acinetobacter sp. HR7]
MKKGYGMLRLVQAVAVLFVLFGLYLIFLYSPFYSTLVVKGLNYFVPVEVNQVAAQSQKQAALSVNENLEPGSEQWIARQAYLRVMEEDISKNQSQNLSLIQARYKALQQLLEDEREAEAEKSEQQKIQVPLLANEAAVSEAQADDLTDLLNLKDGANTAQMEEYVDFLKNYDIEAHQEKLAQINNIEFAEDLESINHKEQPVSESEISKPYAIVVLGGGLTLDKNGKDIVVNDYTRLRLEKTLEVEKAYDLPIVLSGVEAPYMQLWLQNYAVDAKLLEDRSMNTCENSRFSSLLLQKKGGAPTVILITDRYHMPRTRRLFALNGIQTIPVEAPMPQQLTRWRPSVQNYDHSRRANYELLATLRDVWFGSSDCREVP